MDEKSAMQITSWQVQNGVNIDFSSDIGATHHYLLFWVGRDYEFTDGGKTAVPGIDGGCEHYCGQALWAENCGN